MEINEMILSYRDYYGSYHHHKEQMAYGATVLYLTGATFVILNGRTIKESSVPSFVVVGLLAAAFLLTVLFVFWQFRKRELAADIVEACTTLLTRQVAEPSVALETKSVCYKGLDLPKALADILSWKYANRKFFLSPRVSEALTYLAIVIWSLLACLSIWLSSPSQ